MAMRIHRRRLLETALVAAASMAAPAVIGQARPRVVVVGGGAGGATAARYMARDSNGQLAVTLVEENELYHTCFHSNLYLGGFKSYAEITHRYDTLASRYGIALARDAGSAVFLTSADLSELLSLSDRMIVLYRGRIVAAFSNTTELTPEMLGSYMLGFAEQPVHERQAALA